MTNHFNHIHATSFWRAIANNIFLKSIFLHDRSFSLNLFRLSLTAIVSLPVVAKNWTRTSWPLCPSMRKSSKPWSLPGNSETNSRLCSSRMRSWRRSSRRRRCSRRPREKPGRWRRSWNFRYGFSHFCFFISVFFCNTFFVLFLISRRFSKSLSLWASPWSLISWMERTALPRWARIS